MAELLGANLDELDRLSVSFARAARSIASLQADVEHAMSIAWAGKDADRFHQSWRADHCVKLQSAIDGLAEAHQNIDRQRAVGGGNGRTCQPGRASGRQLRDRRSAGSAQRGTAWRHHPVLRPCKSEQGLAARAHRRGDRPEPRWNLLHHRAQLGQPGWHPSRLELDPAPFAGWQANVYRYGDQQ